MKSHDEEHELLDKLDDTFDDKLDNKLETQRHVDNTGTQTRTRLTSSSLRARASPRKNPFSAWLLWLVFAILLGLFAGALFGFRHKDELRRMLLSQERGELAIKLHPAKHSTRDPTTLTFHWNITRGTRSPDGVEKQVYLVNGQFPGPTIEARSGDRIVVNVHNGLFEDEGVSLHWHGLRMKGHNSMDGAVGFTQCPIPSGRDFTYDFRIGSDEHGTFWWHSHAQLQRADGLFGGFVVHKPRRDRDHVPHDEALLLVGDWFHRPQQDIFAWYSDAGSLGNEPVPDSVLVNGRGRYNCSMAVPARPVKCKPVALDRMRPLFYKRASRTRLRVVNTGTIAGVNLKLDGATLRPMEVDGGCAVDAQSTDSLGVLYPGERVDLEVSWRESYTEHPWLNVYLDEENFRFSNPALAPNHTFPVIPKTVRGADRKAAPLRPEGHQDLALLPAAATVKPIHHNSTQETILFYIKTQKLAIYGNKPVGFFNHTYWQPQELPLLSQPRESWDEHQLVPLIGADAQHGPKQVTLVLNNLDDGSHPFHLHGYSFNVLKSYRTGTRAGFGSYNPFDRAATVDGEWSRSPLRKDTVSVPRRGHVVLSFTADNPGIWMLHCHMLVHMAAGMAAGFQVGNVSGSMNADGDDLLGREAPTDASAAQLCAAGAPTAGDEGR